MVYTLLLAFDSPLLVHGFTVYTQFTAHSSRMVWLRMHTPGSWFQCIYTLLAHGLTVHTQLTAHSWPIVSLSCVYTIDSNWQPILGSWFHFVYTIGSPLLVHGFTVYVQLATHSEFIITFYAHLAFASAPLLVDSDNGHVKIMDTRFPVSLLPLALSGSKI